MLTMPLLEGLDGVEKMSKSKGNYVGITEPANTMFAKLLSISDAMMWRYYTLLSFRPKPRSRRSGRSRRRAATPRTPRCCWRARSPRASTARRRPDAAEADFQRRASGGVPDDVPEVALAGAPLAIGACSSRPGWCLRTSEALRMVEQGGVRIDGAVVSDKGLKIAAGTFVVQVGKRKFARVTLAHEARGLAGLLLTAGASALGRPVGRRACAHRTAAGRGGGRKDALVATARNTARRRARFSARQAALAIEKVATVQDFIEPDGHALDHQRRCLPGAAGRRPRHCPARSSWRRSCGVLRSAELAAQQGAPEPGRDNGPMQVSAYLKLSIAVALATIALKTGAWWVSGSVSLLSDALESLVNLAGAMFALAMVTVAARPADDDHPYGHHKAEYFSSGFEGVLIFVAALAIVVAAVHRCCARSRWKRWAGACCGW